MENVDQGLVSIFQAEQSSGPLRHAMKDLSKLAGVIAELSQGDYFHEPIKIHQFLLVLHLLNEEALGLTSSIEDVRTLVFRFRNKYGYDPNISVDHLINVLDKFGWIHKSKTKITMNDVGKRMMDVLIRLANDSLAYYMQDEITRSLYQANRDADLSEAYDDKGISGGNKLASMIKNIEDAVEKLKERELEYLADRYALPQVEIIHNLIKGLHERFEERFQRFQTFEESLLLEPIIKRGTSVILEGSEVSLGTIKKILRFTHIQESPIGVEIRHDSFRTFMQNSFTKLDMEQPDAHEVFSFMEQDRREGERLDGLWIPVKFASPVSPSAIEGAIDYLENYEPYTEQIEEMPEEEYEEVEELTEEEIAQHMDEERWSVTKEQIHTEALEAYLEQIEEVNIEAMVLEAGSEKWTDAVNTFIALSALMANNRADMAKDPNEPKQSNVVKEWEWMDEDDRRQRIRSKRTERV